MKTIWQKGNSTQNDREWFDDFTASEDRGYDQYLIPHDIICNLAQSAMLQKIGVLTPSEYKSLSDALKSYFSKWEEGSFGLSDEDEDVHSCIEKHLTNDCGDAGKKIHTGRSRNDQVMTDVRLFLKSRLLGLAGKWMDVLSELEQIVKRHPNTFFAGLTHTQPAMPSSVDAWVAGYQDLLLSDLKAIMYAYGEVDRSPLGSAAGYGAPYFDLDRNLTSKLMGFSEVQNPVTAVQPGRGGQEKRVTDALGYGALTFNRMASDVVLFAHPMFGYVTLSDNQTSGSSIMPQKRNPDAWELIRAAYHPLAGTSAQLASVSANLTSGYHRDLQITKKAVMDAVFMSDKLATAVKHALAGLDFNTEACSKSLTPEVFATHEANRLVSGGMPFREAYREAARAVAETSVLSPADLRNSYTVSGFPGRYDTAAYTKRKQPIQDWLSAEKQKQDDFLHNLLRSE